MIVRASTVIIGTCLALVAFPAFAADPQLSLPAQAAKLITEGLSAFPSVIAIFAQIVGFAYALKGAFALRAAGMAGGGLDSSQETKKALFYVVAGVLAVSLPAFVGLGATTLFGSKSAIMNSEQPTIRRTW